MDLSMRNVMLWGIWLTIPLIVDILAGLMGAIMVMFGYWRRKHIPLLFEPYLTILIPVYNSAKTLTACLNSITSQSYPIRTIQLLLIDNGSTDNSKEIFWDFQMKNPKLRAWWISSSKGKAKALNMGLYAAEGKYIINIDSDGILERNAILRVVEKFEANEDIYAMTGVVLIDPDLIEKTSGWKTRTMQRCEFFEYLEAFLIGRGGQSMTNSMFTLSGAFSCFRREALLKTQLYNNVTLGEDTHMTSQIREFFKGRIALCEKAFFFVDPIESTDKLYIQRQRWQRGQIEVTTLFRNNKDVVLKGILKLSMIKDHTLVFPRLIWIFAMVYLIFIDYPLQLVVTANLIIYLAYVLSSLIYYFVSKKFIKHIHQVDNYMSKHSYIIIILPLYRIVVFFIRFAGIINSHETIAKWNAMTFSEEIKIIRESLKKRFRYYYIIKGWINNE